LGKAAAVTEIVSLSSAERTKHVRDVDALARLLGPVDRAGVAPEHQPTDQRVTASRLVPRVSHGESVPAIGVT
jgi:hypothetical protein